MPERGSDGAWIWSGYRWDRHVISAPLPGPQHVNDFPPMGADAIRSVISPPWGVVQAGSDREFDRIREIANEQMAAQERTRRRARDDWERLMGGT